MLGFNTFLPEGYKIELPMDASGQPFAVYRAPGQPGVTQIFGAPTAPVPAAGAGLPSGPGAAPAAAAAAIAGQAQGVVSWALLIS